MNHISYDGRTGNQLFQYMYNWMRSTGKTIFDPIAGFPELKLDKPGEVFFECSDCYVPHRVMIRNMMALGGGPIDGVAVHVRGGDAATQGFRCPPFSYYEKAIGQVNKKPVTLFTDDVLNDVCKQLIPLVDYVVSSDEPMYDFHSIRRHSSIIIGNSTFAWWAAFLSNHNNVIQCEPTSGWRSKEMPSTCLIVEDWHQIQYDPVTNH